MWVVLQPSAATWVVTSVCGASALAALSSEME
jgi:hypothetical protein